MTLILNEIHLLNGLSESIILAAADRRITLGGRYHSTRRKLFPIRYLKGAISYFGLAFFYRGGREVYFSDWLPNFISHQSTSPNPSLGSFAQNLRDELNQIIQPALLQFQASGFHICGYDSNGYPDFWYLSNIGGRRNSRYVNLRPQYARPSSHFLGRDARNVFGWDGSDPRSARNAFMGYRNGDFRAHEAAWNSLDDIFKKLFHLPDFKAPRNPSGYKKYVEFKLEFIAYTYKKWATWKIIGKPIDVLVFHNP